MFPTGSFEAMEFELRKREYEKGTDIPITVGILIADFRRRFCKENIFDNIERLDKKTGPLIDFYIPGYCLTSEIDTHYQNSYRLKNGTYSFSSQYFDEFVEHLENIGITVTGRTQLILLNYHRGSLKFDDIFSIDLEDAERSGKIKSVKLFFDQIIEIASHTTEYPFFERTINTNFLIDKIVGFIKEKMPDLILSSVIPNKSKSK